MYDIIKNEIWNKYIKHTEIQNLVSVNQQNAFNLTKALNL